MAVNFLVICYWWSCSFAQQEVEDFTEDLEHIQFLKLAFSFFCFCSSSWSKSPCYTNRNSNSLLKKKPLFHTMHRKAWYHRWILDSS